MAEWQSGHAADCKSVYAGSIPTSASAPVSALVFMVMLAPTSALTVAAAVAMLVAMLVATLEMVARDW